MLWLVHSAAGARLLKMAYNPSVYRGGSFCNMVQPTPTKFGEQIEMIGD